MIAAITERATWRAALPSLGAAGPFRLVSLWDMLRFQADDFLKLMKSLSRITDAMSGLEGASSVYETNPEVHARHCAELWDILKPTLGNLAEACRSMELRDPAVLAEGLSDKCSGKAYSIPELRGSLSLLGELIENQLNGRVFMFVPSAHAKFFREKPFGEIIEGAFSEAIADVEDASSCLGVGRPTAAVFHLMCVMEFGIRHLAKRLKVPRKEITGKVWQVILTKINDRVKKLKSEARRDVYAEMVAHLHNVKNAWRNPTMHTRRRYSQEEAEAIFENVKTFMHSLASLAAR